MAESIVKTALDGLDGSIADRDLSLMPLMLGAFAHADIEDVGNNHRDGDQDVPSGTADDISMLGVFDADAEPGGVASLEAPLRVEAEALTRDSGFKLETIGAASGDQVIKSTNPEVEARASFTFSGQDGIYDINIGHFDEADGVSSLSLFVDGVEVETFLLDQQLGSNNANNQTATVHVVEDVAIATGDLVELVGFSDGGEPLRVDYLEFAFQGSGEPPSLVVDTAEDVVDPNDGKTSLREAVALANATAGHDTVSFDASVFDGDSGDILRLTQGEIVITDAVTIHGGTAGVTITGDANGDDVVLTGGITDVDASLDAGTLDDNSRIFNVTADTAATTIEGLTLTGGRVAGDRGSASGGAVRSEADLTIVGSIIDGNLAQGDAAGGGVYGLAEVNITDSTITRNQVDQSDVGQGFGGGVWAGGPLYVTNSTVSDNRIGAQTGYEDNAIGGGIYAGASVTLTGSTVSGNSTSSDNVTRGGGIYASGGVTLIDSSVRDNFAYGELDGFGGGIFADSVSSTSSTISGNTAAAAEGLGIGGGIRADSVTLVNSTVSGNDARAFGGGRGGGINANAATLSNSTVTGNTTSNSGGATYQDEGIGGGIYGGTVELANSIVLGNFQDIGGAPSEIEGTVVQNGPNIIGGVDPADVFEDIDPDTGGGLLADNGGPTETVAILATGPAAGGADPATATETDQRGVARDADPDLGAFEAEEATPPPPAEFRIEAETLARESGFRVENLAVGSGGQVIKSPDPGVEARASFDFAGPDGVYDINLGYFDENDGQASLAVFVNGVEVDSFSWDQDLGSPLATAQTHAVRHIENVSIETGDVVEIVGFSNGSEPLRVDYLEFASEGSPGEPPSLVVNTTEDVVDGSDGLTSLREAVAFANATAGHDTVTFDASVFDGEPEDILRLTQGEIAITDAVTIDGGAAGVTITGDANGDDVVLTGGITDAEESFDAGTLADNSRIFNVTNASANMTLDGLTLTGGQATASFPSAAAGGAVRSAADLTLVDTTIAGNIADGNASGGFATALGAGVYSLGEVTLDGSAIKDNVASSNGDPGRGGGIWAGGDVELTNSTVSGNSLDTYGGSGGGVYSLGSVTLTGSIVSDNTAVSFNETRGAGVFASYEVTLTDSTVRDNFGYGELGAYGGGIYADHVLSTASTISGNGIAGGEGSGQGGGINANSVTLVNSTVANNLARNLYGGDGGGIFAGTVSLSNTTVTGNIARATIPNYTDPGEGGGILAGIVETENSIVLGNFDRIDGAPSEIVGTVVETGPNIIGGVDPADVFADIDPDTGGGLLADNGGPTETVAILATGPAAGGADPATATETDQRGVARDADPDLGAFEAEEVAQPPTAFRVEAETLARESGFKLENLSAASGGQVIKSPNPSVEASASFTFAGQDGTYDLDLAYFDENDGASELSILVAGVEVDSFVFSEELGSKNANSSTHTVRHIDDLQIETGDVIELVGHSDGGEPLRIDFLDFNPVDDLIG